MGQELERERAAQHLAAIGAVIAAAAAPPLPPVQGRGQPAVGRRTQARQDPDPPVGIGERQVTPVALGQADLAAQHPASGIRGQRHIAVEQREATGVLAAPDARAPLPQLHLRAPEIGPRREPDLEPDLTAHALQNPKNLPVRTELVGLRHRHQIGHADASARRLEAALEHRAVVTIATPDDRVARGPDRKMAAAPIVEHPGEQRWRGEGRGAQPVDRARPGDQRRRTAVADHRVVADQGIAGTAVPVALLVHVNGTHSSYCLLSRRARRRW